LRCSVWIVNYLRTDLLCMLCYKQKGTGWLFVAKSRPRARQDTKATFANKQSASFISERGEAGFWRVFASCTNILGEEDKTKQSKTEPGAGGL
jgi:hypothetical protein